MVMALSSELSPHLTQERTENVDRRVFVFILLTGVRARKAILRIKCTSQGGLLKGGKLWEEMVTAALSSWRKVIKKVH